MQRHKGGAAVVTFLSMFSPFKSFCQFHSPFNHVLVSSPISHKTLDLGCVSHSGIALMEWLSSQNRRNQHVGDQHICFVSTFNIYKIKIKDNMSRNRSHASDHHVFERITALCDI